MMCQTSERDDACFGRSIARIIFKVWHHGHDAFLPGFSARSV